MRAQRADVALLCSLGAQLQVDRQELANIAQETLAEEPGNPFLQLVRGATLYRLGAYEEALATLPGPGAPYANPKDQLLPIIFRAMSHWQLSDAYTARKILEDARKAVGEQAAEPEGAEMPFQDRPTVWCMVHTLLREAEAMIGPERPVTTTAATKSP